jgi:hypothetical protein
VKLHSAAVSAPRSVERAGGGRAIRERAAGSGARRGSLRANRS